MSQESENPPSDAFRSVLRAAVMSLLMLLTVAGVKSYRDLANARAHEADLRQRIEVSRKSIQGLEQRIERIRTDPAMLEQLAREELGWVRENDLVIVLPDDPMKP